MKPDTVQSVVDAVMSLPEGTRFYVAFPLRFSDLVTHAVVVENLRAQGFLRVSIDDEVMHLDDLPAKKIDVRKADEVLVVVDRLVVSRESVGRLTDAIGTAFADGDGDCIIIPADGRERMMFTERFECAYDHTRAPTPTPQLFSFNNPRGACPTCNGFGAILEYDLSVIVPNPERTLRDGAIDPWTKPRYDGKRRALAEFARRERISMDVPWAELSEHQKKLLLTARTRGYKGILPFLEDLEEKRYKQYIRIFLRQYQTAQECPTCHGTKLKPESLNVRIANMNIAEVAQLPVGDLSRWLDALQLTPFEQSVADTILREASERVRFLRDVGLDYLAMNRATRTLSGGEAQRIGLANSLGSQLVDTLYVLDEPSIGLHPRDMGRLLTLLHRLRDTGNTVLVVEHDPAAIEAAHRKVSEWRARDSDSVAAQTHWSPVDHIVRSARAQSPRDRHPHSNRMPERSHWSFRLGQEYSRTRRSLSRTGNSSHWRAFRQAASG
jgi:excinuclease ABC subunit A